MKRLIAAAALACASPLHAQSTSDSIAQYRSMLADGNPAELWQAKGEALWKQARGPKKASLERCDLGRGPGLVKGAFVELPRYFADTGRVQDLESRLLTCMQELQGFDATAIAKTSFGKGEMVNIENLIAYVSGESMGMQFNVSQAHGEEKAMYNAGRKIFYFRAGPYDFSCASCHGQDGKRIRLQELPELATAKGAGSAFSSWPAYRVSSGQLWGLQRRLNDCFRQQRFPSPGYVSDVTIALSMFLGVNAKGTASAAPALAR